MELNRINKTFGLDAKNRINETTDESFSGAIACLETFYYAFNNRDLDTFKKIWLNHELIQLNNPLGGIITGVEPITELYDNLFNGQEKERNRSRKMGGLCPAYSIAWQPGSRR